MLWMITSSYLASFHNKMKFWVVGIGVILSLAFFVGSKNAISLQPTNKTDENLGLLLRLGKEVRPITFVDTKGKKWEFMIKRMPRQLW